MQAGIETLIDPEKLAEYRSVSVRRIEARKRINARKGEEIARRNQAIRGEFQALGLRGRQRDGSVRAAISRLAARHYLSVKSIEKIVYNF